MERTFSVFAIVIFPVVIRELYGWVWGHIRARACVAMAYARNMDSSPRVNKRILGQIFLIILGTRATTTAAVGVGLLATTATAPTVFNEVVVKAVAKRITFAAFTTWN